MSLDPYPSPAELRRIAQERGALPRIATATPRSGRTTPSVRPWHPYRSKLEYLYAQRLELERRSGVCRVEDGAVVLEWEYEPERLVIGVRAYYKPDFRVTLWRDKQTWHEWHETKGFAREASIVRIKAAALRYPNETFVIVTKKAGQWHHQIIR